MEQTLKSAATIRWCSTLVVVATFLPAACVCQATTVSDALDEIGYTRLVTILGELDPQWGGGGDFPG